MKEVITAAMLFGPTEAPERPVWTGECPVVESAEVSDDLVTVGEPTELSATFSGPQSGGIYTTHWAQYHDGDGVKVIGDSPDETWVCEEPGYYVLFAMVTEDFPACMDMKFIGVHCLPNHNSCPSMPAVVSPRDEADVGQTIFLNAYPYDLDGDSLTFYWVVETPDEETEVLTAGAGNPVPLEATQTQYVCEVPGPHRFMAVVDDDMSDPYCMVVRSFEVNCVQ